MEHRAGRDYASDLGLPREYPFTRGPYPTMYRGRPWTRRQIVGYGTANSTFSAYVYCIEPVSQSPLTGFTLGRQTDSSVLWSDKVGNTAENR